MLNSEKKIKKILGDNIVDLEEFPQEELKNVSVIIEKSAISYNEKELSLLLANLDESEISKDNLKKINDTFKGKGKIGTKFEINLKLESLRGNKDSFDTYNYLILPNLDILFEFYNFDIGQFKDKINNNEYENFNEFWDDIHENLKEKDIYVTRLSLSGERKYMQNPKKLYNWINTILSLINEILSEDLILLSKRDKKKKDINTFDTMRNKATLLYSFDENALNYLLSAQKASSIHLKFLEYYHILEMFIPDVQDKILRENLDKIVQEYYLGKLGSPEVIRNRLKELKIFSQYEEKRAVINIIKKIEDKLEETYSAIESIFGEKEPLAILPSFISRDTKEDIKINNKDSICPDKVGKRIYAVRNAIVHSKMYIDQEEPKDVFIPTENREKELEKELFLIRLIVIELLLKYSQDKKIWKDIIEG
ncbi:MAG: hypothetical protein KAV48_06140 [Methanomicrobia archaeon]|nr:hypothetical protein [Methanomicrobia archaeon]